MAAWEFQSLQNIAEANGWHKFISMQSHYNLTYREEEREMIPYCTDTGVGLIHWSSIARGALARPWGDRSTKRESTDQFLNNLVRDQNNEVDKAIIDRVEEVAGKRGVNMATVATAWVLSKALAIPPFGVSSKERIDAAG